MLFENALLRVLTPLARLAMARGLRYGAMADVLKQAFVEAAKETSVSQPLTVSRLSLQTGLQRRDVSARLEASAPSTPKPNPVARMVALWLAEGGDLLSTDAFDTLSRSISQDIHPRTLRDEMQRLGMVTIDQDGLSLNEQALIAPNDDETMMNYFGDNLGDHAAAAAENIVNRVSSEAKPAGDQPTDAQTLPGHLERAAHYSHLSDASVRELDELANRLSERVLGRMNRRALRLQNRDSGQGNYRIRFGTYFYHKEDPPE